MFQNGSIENHPGWRRIESIFMSQRDIKERHKNGVPRAIRENRNFPGWMNDLIGEMESEYRLIESELVCR
jgi:hypothetical protein